MVLTTQPASVPSLEGDGKQPHRKPHGARSDPSRAVPTRSLFPRDAGARALLHAHLSRLCPSRLPSQAPGRHLPKARPLLFKAADPEHMPSQLKETRALSSIITHRSPRHPSLHPPLLPDQGPTFHRCHGGLPLTTPRTSAPQSPAWTRCFSPA